MNCTPTGCNERKSDRQYLIFKNECKIDKHIIGLKVQMRNSRMENLSYGNVSENKQ